METKACNRAAWSASNLSSISASTQSNQHASFWGHILMDIPERQAADPGSEAAKSEADPNHSALSQEEIEDENKRIRRLQIMMNMVMAVISQEEMTLEEASEMVANAKRAALAMFPDKELAYDLIYKPRLQRLIRERFRLQ
jgi:hypothetical protein